MEECGGDVTVTDNPAELATADRILLPGVGAFPAATANLKCAGLFDALREEVARRSVPLLGICLGMQLLAEESDENGPSAGLGLIPGRVERLISPYGVERIPHMGWNTVRRTTNSPLLDGLADETDFYFVHSYHFNVVNDYKLAETPYCGEFASVVGRGNVFGTQFHPEKSLRAGFRILTNFLSI